MAEAASNSHGSGRVRSPKQSRRKLDAEFRFNRRRKSTDLVDESNKPNTSSSSTENDPPSPAVDSADSLEDCSRRLTRSGTKRWLKEYESNASSGDRNPKESESLAMGPPKPHNTQLLRSGVLTRQRYKILKNSGLIDPYCNEVNRISANFNKKLSFDRVSNTSDYGTASEHSRKCSVLSGGMSPVSDSGDSCQWGSISGVESLTTVSEDNSLYQSQWTCDRAEPNVGTWNSPSSFKNIGSNPPDDLGNPSFSVSVLKANNIYAFIPGTNQTGYQGKFTINLKSDGDDNNTYRPQLCAGLRIHHVSPVVSVEPHGIQFYEEYPVQLVIPLSVEPECEEWLSCLYSNTESGSSPFWERLPRNDYKYMNGSVVITTNHFSLFTVILEEPFPEVMKTIRRRTGGRLQLPEVPGVEVVFPPGSLHEDLGAYLRLLYNHEPVLDDCNERQEVQGALASPVIMLGPHGHTFNTGSQPVRVKLPVPHFHEIRKKFGSRTKLCVWQSSTREGEPTSWQRLHTTLTLEESERGVNVPVVSFPVRHFSFFKIVWDLLSSSLQEAKMGMSYFYPYISFSMMCQAFMDQSKNDARFSLQVICYRSDKTLPETVYSHRVGTSTKPRLVRPGRVLVRLRSQRFEADVDAGEDESLAKEESDFRGRDFEKQYACRFKPDVNIEKGAFGKVIVERVTQGNNNSLLFEFNLDKSGTEQADVQPAASERWTALSIKELAGNLQITEGKNWKRLAQQLGFTKSEIKSNLKHSPDPFLSMINLFSNRGGKPEDFLKGMYTVSRELVVSGGINWDSGSDDSGTGSGASRGSAGSRGNKFQKLWSLSPWAQNSLDSDAESMAMDAKEENSRKRSRTSLDKKNSSKGSGSAKRRKFSDVSETVTSSADEDEKDGNKDSDSANEAKSNDQHINNRRKLNDQDMWKISKGIARKDWRFLGRSLGIEERVLGDLEHQYQPIGFRECAYQMLLEWKGRHPRKCTFGSLYSALIRENMVDIAKHMVKLLPDTEEDARERDLL